MNGVTGSNILERLPEAIYLNGVTGSNILEGDLERSLTGNNKLKDNISLTCLPRRKKPFGALNKEGRRQGYGKIAERIIYPINAVKVL